MAQKANLYIKMFSILYAVTLMSSRMLSQLHILRNGTLKQHYTKLMIHRSCVTAS